jgi:hypothetical protein
MVAAVTATGLGACGGGGEHPDSTATAEAKQLQASAEVKARNKAVREEYQERHQAEAPTSEEAEAKGVASSFYAIIDQDEAADNPNKTEIDTASFCELMSEEAVAQTIHYAKVSSGVAKQWDCESAVELLVIRSKRTGGFEGAQKAEVLGVNAQGNQATATVRFGDGPATSLPLVREDGEWKLAANTIR